MSYPIDSEELLLDDGVENAEAALESSASAADPSPTTYANKLMDELFGDVDRILDSTMIPPAETIPATAPPRSSNLNLELAAFVTNRYPQLVPPAGSVPGLVSSDEPTPELPAPDTELTRHRQRQESYNLFERLLLFVGATSATAALVIWLGSQGILGRVMTAMQQMGHPPVATQPTINPTEAQFAAYLQRSLDAVQRQPIAAAGSQGSGDKLPGKLPGNGAIASLPANGQPNASSNSLPSIKVAAAPVASSLPLPTPNPSQGSTVPQNSTVQRNPSATNSPASAANVGNSRSEVDQILDRLRNLLNNAPANRPVPVAQAPVSGGRASNPRPGVAPSAAATVPAPQRTLRAVLEMGNSSAVLFEMNGVTQRYEPGETIGSSGWTLVEVAKDTIVVRRNGEVRTVSVGQKL
ncbi:MAG: hypothetical protein VKJ24_03285 [Synechococcales bacterium]|nr:hypothetical protein [Synechococcales bacterium]